MFCLLEIRESNNANLYMWIDQYHRPEAQNLLKYAESTGKKSCSKMPFSGVLNSDITITSLCWRINTTHESTHKLDTWPRHNSSM